MSDLMARGRATGVLGLATALYAVDVLVAVLPTDDVDRAAPFNAFERTSSLALAMLLAALGFQLTTTLLEARATSWRTRASRTVVPVVQLFAMSALLAGAALTLADLDSTDTTPAATTRTSAAQLFTLRWNHYILDHALGVRGDLTSAWVLAVVAQLAAALGVAVLVLGRRPGALALLAGVAVAAGAAWRWHVVVTDGWFTASLSTTCWTDAFCIGVVAAVLARRVRVAPGDDGALVGAFLLAICGLVIGSAFTSVEEGLQIVVPLGAAATAGLCYALHRTDDRRFLAVTALRSNEIASLGTLWLPVTAWTPFVVPTMQRHLQQQGSAIVILASVAAIAVLARATQALWTVALEQWRTRHSRGLHRSGATAD